VIGIEASWVQTPAHVVVDEPVSIRNSPGRGFPRDMRLPAVAQRVDAGALRYSLLSECRSW
jgi:hypothetical protein